jgi:hypothetical protein
MGYRYQLNLRVEGKEYKDFSHYQISQLKKFGFRSLGNGYQYSLPQKK